MNSKKIIWLASYFKSGNTWFRVFLSALLNPSREFVNINNLYPSSTIASSRELFDETICLSSSDLLADEIDSFRPYVYRQNANDANMNLYYKVHDAWVLTPHGIPMFPKEITKAVLYFIRNPLDIAVSFQNHLSIGIDETIEIMNDPHFTYFYKDTKSSDQLRQVICSWSQHVKSWVNDSGLPVLVLKYEDMLSKPRNTFKKAIQFLDIKASTKEIDRAISLSNFSHLKNQELEVGFSEKNPRAKAFFRKGKADDWKKVLTNQQAQKIIDVHKEIMLHFGYL